jgi:PhzF family phenazine biosynthesis protein
MSIKGREIETESVKGVSGIPIYRVDAFTSEPFKGNPAVVCVVDSNMDDQDFQAIAMEMNPLSETAFLAHLSENKYRLRWFTLKEEVWLCGHATLATAHVLFNDLSVEESQIEFHTLSGILRAEKFGKKVRLDFPRDNPVPIEVPHQFLEALGIEAPEDVAYGRNNRYLIVVAEEEEVKGLEPDIDAMARFELPFEIKGVSVTSKASGGYDIVSRFFAPWLGVDEDPVTGSLHTILVPYWCDKLGKEELLACQASKRSGEMSLTMDDERVYITGESVTLVKGNLLDHEFFHRAR